MDAFVSRLAADGSALLMSSYVGGSAEDFGEAITIDRLGTIYVAGTSRSADFPKQNAAQPDIGGVLDAFLLQISETRTGTGLAILPPTPERKKPQRSDERRH